MPAGRLPVKRLLPVRRNTSNFDRDDKVEGRSPWKSHPSNATLVSLDKEERVSGIVPDRPGLRDKKRVCSDDNGNAGDDDVDDADEAPAPSATGEGASFANTSVSTSLLVSR